MTLAAPPFDQTTSYYRAAFACLQYVETRRPTRRRFGQDADARWKAFKGHLSASDRIDLLLRDANVEWPGAFGAREVFALPSVAEDEAFGAAWRSLDPVDGEALWRELSTRAAPSGAREALLAVAQAWGLQLARMGVEAPDPADRIVVVGPSAIAAVAEVFVGRSDLDWSAQVSCVASPPAHRHLALCAAAIVDTHRLGRVLSADEARMLPRGARVIQSEDAARADAEALQGSL
jgi:hypothetical protein